MRGIISGGGTGGHIYPAITIAKALKEAVAEKDDCDLLFVGTQGGLEADIVPEEGFAFTTIEVQGLRRQLSLENVRAIKKVFTGYSQAKRIIKEFKPDIAIGTGGYVCGPVLLAAALNSVPTIIQEQNVVAGITNKILAWFVDRIAVGYPEAKENFGRNQHKVVITGNPIRPEVLAAERAQGIEQLGLDPKKKTVLVSGGSRGARSINKAMSGVYAFFADNQDIQIVHATGQAEYENVLDSIKSAGIDLDLAGNIIIKSYLYNMPLALAVADLAVFRAGAVGLAELTARKVPAILIPYPYAAENHQEYNARIMEKYGAAVVIQDSEINGTRLAEAIDAIIHDPVRQANMARTSGLLGRPEAAQNIAKLALELLKN